MLSGFKNNKLQIFELFIFKKFSTLRIYNKCQSRDADTAHRTQDLIASYGKEHLPHPPYSLDLEPGDYQLFLHLKKLLRGHSYSDNDTVKTAVMQ